MAIVSITDFFQEIARDLYTSLYLAIGGSLEEDSRDWSSHAVELVSTAIKILILLAVVGFFYWLIIYTLKHNKARIRLNDRRAKILRSILRYIWFFTSLIAIMSQIHIEPSTVKATAKGPEYIAAFEHMANLATKAGVTGHHLTIQTPLQQLSKAQTIELGLTLGVDYGQTISCYKADNNGLACGMCDSCALRRQGFAQAGVTDPTRYQPK